MIAKYLQTATTVLYFCPFDRMRESGSNSADTGVTCCENVLNYYQVAPAWMETGIF